MSENALRLIASYVEEAAAARARFFADHAELVDAAARTMAVALARGGKILFCGNGGSAGDAQHLAAEFVNRFELERPPLPALALTTDSSALTAIGNDYGFEQVFSRQLAGKARPGDLFLGITTSGASRNILAALAQCRQMGLPSLVFTARDGGAAAALADHCIAVPGAATSTIQELHIVLAHTLCECVEAALFPAH